MSVKVTAAVKTLCDIKFTPNKRTDKSSGRMPTAINSIIFKNKKREQNFYSSQDY
jgi:hypothetical protein